MIGAQGVVHPPMIRLFDFLPGAAMIRDRVRDSLHLACAVLAAAFTILVANPVGADGEPELAERLRRVVASTSLSRARVAVLVERESDGEVIFALTPDRPLIPASNVKILTAIAALDAFGPTHRFETVIASPAPPNSDGEVSALWVTGGGDPSMTSEEWWRLAADLRKQGIRRVTGPLVLDDRAFDAVRWHQSWGATSSRAYHAPVGALNANYGSFSVTVTPGANVGDPVRVTVDPPVPYLKIRNAALTGQRGTRSGLVVDRRLVGGSEVVDVTGEVPAGRASKVYHRSVLDPTGYAGAVLRMQLAAVGIEVDGPTLTASAGGQAATGAPADHELLRFEGRQLADIVRLFVKYSNNTIAESLVKALGAQSGARGSWTSGTPEMRRRLLQLGLDPGGFDLVDGSGLSYENKVSPRTLVGALRLARASFRFGPELISALPIAGRDGTLSKRAEGADEGVRAKTGLLNRITALSGFASMPDGERAVFSILVNGYPGTDEAAMDAVDRFVTELVTAPIPAAPAAAEPVAGG